MKKYVVIAAFILVAGSLVNYKFGGFNKVEPQLIEVSNYTIYGANYEGSYKSDGLISLVDSMRSKQAQLDEKANVAIVNYVNQAKEKFGIVTNFVGIILRSDKLNEILNLEKRVIKAKKAVRVVVNISPIGMPAPEKLKSLANEIASNNSLELQGMSIEQYSEDGKLIVDFPIKEPATYIEKLAEAYGISSFDYTKTYHYTFNVKKGEAGVARSWEWQPNSGKVTLISKGDTTKFNHNSLLEEQQKLDHTFINDKYWLLFPFQLVWDTGYEHSIVSNTEAPISKAELTMLTITYNSEDGYTPGDAYDFYIDDKFEIKEWSFRKGGQPEPSLTTTWEDYQIVEGVKVATNHLSEDGSFRLWFTGTQIK